MDTFSYATMSSCLSGHLPIPTRSRVMLIKKQARTPIPMQISQKHGEPRVPPYRSRTRPKVNFDDASHQVCRFLCLVLTGPCAISNIHFTMISSSGARIWAMRHDRPHIHHGLLDLHTGVPGRQGGGAELTPNSSLPKIASEGADRGQLCVARSRFPGLVDLPAEEK